MKSKPHLKSKPKPQKAASNSIPSDRTQPADMLVPLSRPPFPIAEDSSAGIAEEKSLSHAAQFKEQADWFGEEAKTMSRKIKGLKKKLQEDKERVDAIKSQGKHDPLPSTPDRSGLLAPGKSLLGQPGLLAPGKLLLGQPGLLAPGKLLELQGRLAALRERHKTSLRTSNELRAKA
jgi:hypothetical protein